MSDNPVVPGVPRPDAESTRVVQEAVGRLSDRVPELGVYFYRHLFAMIPEVRPMFPDNMADQRLRLVRALLNAVYAIGDPVRAEVELQRLGEIHYYRGVREDQYQYVPHALLRALRDLSPGEFSTWQSSAWISVYSWMTAHMVAGARRAQLREEPRTPGAGPLPVR
ncbi:MAG: globin domain-containing protein [Kineosporiaceae bacterium]|jgi:hemoglobin-like flavoprotein